MRKFYCIFFSTMLANVSAMRSLSFGRGALKSVSNPYSPLSTTAGKMTMDYADAGQRTFAQYVIYKGKGALGLKGISPSFVSLESGAKAVSREGSIMLEFAASTGNSREYDWSKKVMFAVNPTECGEILVMDPSYGVEFLHDPNMGGPDVGKVTKRLKLTPTQDGKGIFASIQLTDKINSVSSSISVPVSWGELEVVKTLLRYSLPRMLAFDAVFDSPSDPMNPFASDASSSTSNDADSRVSAGNGQPKPTIPAWLKT